MPAALPVQTPELTPGTLSAYATDLKYLNVPVFIVGWDTLSVAWLKLHRQRLTELHAVGMVVNMDTPAHLADLKALVPNLELYPLPGSALARTLSLAHYPALISTSRIEQ
jgi:integrating conjugative element protein (TIGR03765 family)